MIEYNDPEEYTERRCLAVTQLEMVLDVCGFMDEDDILDAAEAWAVNRFRQRYVDLAVNDEARLLNDLHAMAEGTL